MDGNYKEVENRTKVMKIICAYCLKTIGIKDGKGIEGITHGVCEECLIKLEDEIKEERNHIVIKHITE